ncbi:hypothetical protein C8F04DRAFT_1304768 [Mycena alexandri]|uniref:Uncharacterized protein n=1 Tax=Mycena alexandri TaxID=1745969 RepID=A0AAD6S9A2_9AGAR|nr:hypothetical protein C8F04DRAFT_1304768 [Mycena alexandri]
MPTLITTLSLPSPSAESTIAIAGHLYSASQVRTFVRGAGILTAFFLLSYLALVVFPNRTAPPARVPERPFAPRPTAPHASKASTSERAAASPPQQQQYDRLLTPASAPPPYPYTSVAWTAATRIHRIADTVVGAAPASMPLASRRIPSDAGDSDAPHQVFPWVPVTHDFGLVRRRIPPSAYRTAAFPRPPSVAVLEGLARKLNLKYVDGNGNGGGVKTRTKSQLSVSMRRRPFSAVFYGAQGAKVDGSNNLKGRNGKDKAGADCASTCDPGNASVGRGGKKGATGKENVQVPIQIVNPSGIEA